MHLHVAFALGFAAALLALILFGILVNTTRKLTEARRNANRLERQASISLALLDNPSLGLIVADCHGLIVDCNLTAERMLAIDRADLVGRKHTTDFYSEEDLRDEMAALFRDSGIPAVGAPEIMRLRLESGSRAVERELTLVRQDRTRFPASMMISPLTHSTGTLDGFLLTVRDIGDRRQAEQTAQTRQRLIEQFVLHTPAAIALLDRDLKYLAVSDRWVQDYRLGSKNLVGTPYLEQFSPSARRWRDIFHRCLAGAEDQRDEDTILLPDGSEQLMAWRCRPWFDTDGSIGGLALFSEVLAEKRLVQRRLVESETRLREAQSMARVGSWDFDLQSRRLTWSDEMYRIHELPQGLAITLEQTENFYLQDARPLVKNALAEAVSHGKGWDIEAQIESARGQKLWVRSRGQVELKGDKPSLVRCTIQDVTERKNFEFELARAREEALQQARLKAEFLASMSHEIRTPLNAVTGMTSLLVHTKLDGEQREYLQTVRTASDNLLTIINDILDFSKIESGNLTLEREPFSIQECIESSLDLLAVRAQEKNLELGCWVDPMVPAWLAGDVTRLRQIILNLVTNAVKFTNQGEVFVSCRPIVGSDQRARLRVTIRDTGIGIRPAVLPQLFHAYTQAEVSTTRTHGGTGLGLAICRRLVELMEGRIWAESEPGRGSRFHFEIPLLETDRLAPELPYPAHLLRGRRFLVLDDHPTAQEVIQLHLESWGATGIPASTPLAGLALLRRGEVFDGVILDHLMPIMDGIEFARNLQDHPNCPPLILLSPLGRKVAAGNEGVFESVLSKPLKAHQLRASLSRLFEKRDPAVRNATPNPFLSDPIRARVLIVDDNLTNQSVARTVLEQLGATAALASNGAAAVRQLKRESFDFVLMDMQMPDLDGPETTRCIRRDIRPEHQPVIIALTAYATPENRDICLNSGMDDFIAKPLKAETVGATLRNWLEARRSTSQAS